MFFRLSEEIWKKKKLWLSNTQRDNIQDHKDTVICEEHWPEGHPKNYLWNYSLSKSYIWISDFTLLFCTLVSSQFGVTFCVV